MARKSYHEHFRFKNRNGIYYVLYRIEPGRPRSTGQHTEEDAIAWAYAHMGEKVHVRTTLKEFAKDFFIPGKCTWATRMLKKGRTFNAEYFSGHRGRLKTYILPKFGPLLVSAITTKMLDEWLMDLKSSRNGEDLAVESKHKILVCLRKVFGEAVYQGLIDTDPAAAVTPFYGASTEREPFTVEEIQTLFPEGMDELLRIWQTLPWATYFFIMASCGLRPGEVAALGWGDWYRSLHGLIVNKSVENKSGRIKGLKTEKRGTDMKPAILTERAEMLLLTLESQTEDTSPEQLIFGRKNGGTMILESSNKHFKASCIRAGIEHRGRTQYCLRHTFNSHVAKKASLSQLQTAMGHVTMSSSNRYLHPTAEDLLEEVQGIRNIIHQVFDSGT